MVTVHHVQVPVLGFCVMESPLCTHWRVSLVYCVRVYLFSPFGTHNGTSSWHRRVSDVAFQGTLLGLWGWSFVFSLGFPLFWDFLLLRSAQCFLLVYFHFGIFVHQHVSRTLRLGISICCTCTPSQNVFWLLMHPLRCCKLRTWPTVSPTFVSYHFDAANVSQNGWLAALLWSVAIYAHNGAYVPDIKCPKIVFLVVMSLVALITMPWLCEATMPFLNEHWM